ncbi:MAG TPA: MFS transporter [Candidatus Dormibacteraeota bacterium]
MNSARASSSSARAALSFTSFLVIGLFDGALGVVWPFMRAELHQPLSALGLLLVYSTVGFLLLNLALGRVSRLLGLRWMLVIGSFLYAASLALVALGSWPVVIAAAVLWGLAAGFANGAVNVYSTLRMSGGAMQVLHGCWGIGTLLGPLLVTGLVISHHSWRLALLAIAVLQALLGLWALASAQWPSLSRPAREAGDQRLRLSAPLLLGILAFFLYTGAEWAAGQWSFTVLTEDRGYPIATAGLLVSLYWTGLTAGRLAGGAAGLRVATRGLLLAGISLAVLASGLFWWVPAWSAVSLPLLGLGLAPIFPALMTLTSGRVPEAGVGAAVGLQTASSGLGSSVGPAAVGLLLQRFGLALLGPSIFAFALALAAVYWLETRTLERR